MHVEIDGLARDHFFFSLVDKELLFNWWVWIIKPSQVVLSTIEKQRN